MAKFLKQFKERGSVGKSSPVAVPRPGWLGREVPRGAGRAEVLARCWSPPCPRFPPASGGLNVGNTLLGLGDVLGWPHGLGTPLFVQRLRELQHRTRSLLRQRLETLEQLRVLLREEEATASHQLQEAVEKRWSRRPRLRSATSPSPSTSPGLRQHSPGSLRLLHHVQRCLQELQVDKTHRTGSLEHPEVLGGELGTAASEEEWGQPGTRDSPPAAASPKHKRFLVADTPRPSRRKHDCRSRRLL
nr:uncharacterized protein LOC110353943 [Anas platyrhynchos]